jgi:hypothetical protein
LHSAASPLSSPYISDTLADKELRKLKCNYSGLILYVD